MSHYLSMSVNWCFGEGRGKYKEFLCMCDNCSVNIVCMITAGPSVPAIAAMQLMYHSVPRRRVLSGSSAGEPVFCYVFNEHKKAVLVSYCTICQTGRAKQLELHRLQPSTVVSAHLLLLICDSGVEFCIFFCIPKVWFSLNDTYKNQCSTLIKRDVLQSRMAKFVQGKVNLLQE